MSEKFVVLCASSEYGLWKAVYRMESDGRLYRIACDPPKWAGSGEVGFFDGKTVEEFEAMSAKHEADKARYNWEGHSGSLRYWVEEIDRAKAQELAEKMLERYPHQIQDEQRYKHVFVLGR